MQKALTRWGQTVSYHEFEAALGSDIHGKIIASGHDKEILDFQPYREEEFPLNQYLFEKKFKIHPGFSRYYIDLIIHKTDNLNFNSDFSNTPRYN